MDRRAARLVPGARPDPAPRAKPERESGARPRVGPGETPARRESEWGWNPEPKRTGGATRSRLGSEPVGARARDVRARPRRLRSELEPDTLRDARRSQGRDPNRVGRRDRRRVAGPDLCLQGRAARSCCCGGAESGPAEPARRAGSALGFGTPEPETKRCQRVLRARQGPASGDTAGPAAAAYLK